MPDLIFTNEKSSRFHNVTTENKLVRQGFQKELELYLGNINSGNSYLYNSTKDFLKTVMSILLCELVWSFPGKKIKR